MQDNLFDVETTSSDQALNTVCNLAVRTGGKRNRPEVAECPSVTIAKRDLVFRQSDH
jgi:hypothetical protein